MRASELLAAYCEAENTKSNCKEATARKHLERVVGDRVSQEWVYDTQGNSKYPIIVQLIMVSRVYLTRSILHVIRTGSTRGGGTRVTVVPVQRDGATAANDTRAQTPPNPQGAEGSRAEYEEAMKKRLDDIEKQLSAARAGGVLTYQSSSGNEILLEENFDRPVAIGYRDVQYKFIK